jgi:hypothetical protein
MSGPERVAWITGTVGLALSGFGWVHDPHGFHAGWLAAVSLLSGWPIGAMALLLIHALTGGQWGDVLRPALLSAVCALPVLFLAVLPFAVGLPDLYPWARQDAHLANGFYLNVPFFAVRGAIYLGVWFGLGGLILRGRGLEQIAPAGLFVLAVATSFAAIDTTMSLDPGFASSIYGMLTAASMGLFALSLAVLMTTADSGSCDDLGKLLLALVILWIYLDFMQVLIVWQSDLASEAPWYLDRSRGFWGVIGGVIVMGHFVLPMALLLSARMRRSRRVIASVAALLVAMEVLRIWWTVLPSLGLTVGWIDVACVAGVGGLAIGFALWAVRQPNLVTRIRHV